MTVDKLSSWLGIFSNIGIFIGLIFVAYELRQNESELVLLRDAVYLDIGVASNEAIREVNSIIVSDGETAALWVKGNNGEPLTEVEAERYRLLTQIWLRQFQAAYYMNETLEEGRGKFLLPIIYREISGKPGLVGAVNRYNDVQPDPFGKALLDLLGDE